MLPDLVEFAFNLVSKSTSGHSIFAVKNQSIDLDLPVLSPNLGEFVKNLVTLIWYLPESKEDKFPETEKIDQDEF